MEIFKARNFSIGVLGVNVWSRDCLFGFARSPWDFFWFWFLPPFDHPRHLNFEVPPWSTYITLVPSRSIRWCNYVKARNSLTLANRWTQFGVVFEVGFIAELAILPPFLVIILVKLSCNFVERQINSSNICVVRNLSAMHLSLSVSLFKYLHR